MPTDAELLRSYVGERSESAFAELVRRHLNLVYSAALRRTGGRRCLAEEISQKVFTDLARKATTLIHHPALTGWLYCSTRYAAVDSLRAEHRRQKFEQPLEAMHDQSPTSEIAVDWEQLRPVIDEAMDQLKERDRQLVLLRFFNGLTFAELGSRFALSENAARMRTERALEKLRSHLSRHGVCSTPGALALILTSQAVAAAPAGLATTVTATALSAAPTSVATMLLTTFLMSKSTLAALSAAIAAGLTAVTWTAFAQDNNAALASLRQENASLSYAALSGNHAASIATVGETTAGVATLTRAVEKKATQATAGTVARHANRGLATPKDAALTFAWACDCGDVMALSKLLYFDGKGREKAAAVLASMPQSVRAQYRTPEDLYALFIAADSLLRPPPTADVFQYLETVDLSAGRVATKLPGQKKIRHQYQQTSDGWKFVLPESAADDLPGVLSNDILGKLDTK